MRILHTSDWHFGKTLEKASLREAQELFASQLIDAVKSESIDAVVVAGDIYDRAIPSPESMRLLEETLEGLLEHTTVIISSGNHDSPQRLGFGGRLMEKSGLHMRTSLRDFARPVMLEKGKDRVAVYGIPYLEPGLVDHHLDALLGADSVAGVAPTHDSVLRKAAGLIHSDLASRGSVASIVMTHAWFTGAEPSESERALTVGTLGNVGLSALDGFTYGALGHIHRPQDPAEHIRYPGSPIKYSFSERDYSKRMLIVNIDGTSLAGVDEIALPEHRGMAQITGTFEELLTSRAFDSAEACYVKAELTDTETPAHAMDRLRQRFEWILQLKVPQIASASISAGELEEEDPLEVCCNFTDFSRGAPDSTSAWERERFEEAIVAVAKGAMARAEEAVQA